MKRGKEKYIKYENKNIYALYFAREKIIYYNLYFSGQAKVYMLIM